MSDVLSHVEQREESAIVTLGDKQVYLGTPLTKLVTSEAKPLCIYPFIVRYKVNEGVVKEIEYNCFCKVYTFIKKKLGIKDGVAKHKDVIIKSNPPLKELPTSLQHPLLIREKNAYVNLPANLTIDLDMCQTVQDLQMQLNRTGIHYAITIGSQNIPLDNLGEAIFSLSTHKKIEVCVKYDQHKYAYGSVSASSAASSDDKADKVLHEMNCYELYLNWFAMQVFDNLKADDATYNLALNVQSVMEFNMYSSYGRFSNREELYTATLCELLTKFLEDKNHCCLHQVPLHTTSRPDFYVASLKNGVPDLPKLVGDFKVDYESEKKARAETFVLCGHMIHESKNNLPIFAMAGCREAFWLYLVIPESDGKLASFKINEVKVCKTDDLAKFFSAMKYGVTNLNPLEIFGNRSFSIWPTRDLNFELTDSLNESNRVFYCNGIVYKLYDTLNTALNPNEDFIRLLDSNGEEYLPGLRVTTLIEGYQMLQYTYIDERKEVIPLNWFQTVLDALEVLHKNLIVHSDVRYRNLVFTTNGIKLIDFDLAGKVGDPYPSSFRHFSDERHPDASPGKPRKTIHDIHALALIIIRYGVLMVGQRSHLEKCLKDDNASVCQVRKILE